MKATNKRLEKSQNSKKIENSLKILRRVFHGKYFVKINRQENHRHKKAPVKGLHWSSKVLRLDRYTIELFDQCIKVRNLVFLHQIIEIISVCREA